VDGAAKEKSRGKTGSVTYNWLHNKELVLCKEKKMSPQLGSRESVDY